ncbi:MAG: putative Zn-dependent protease, partial [Myxococcota bacterium]
MTRMAAGKLRHALEERPDDVLLMSMYAINWARAGFYADAVAAFALCAGSPLYEQEGILLHADALRETGTPRAAARLRLSQRVDTTSLSDELTILLGAADDLIAAGALDEASAILQEAEGLAPRSVTVHTALAELAESQGDDTSAGFHRWLASLQPQTRSLRARTDEIQLLLEAGELEAAADAIETARAAQPQALRLVALQARLLRLESRTQEALYL